MPTGTQQVDQALITVPVFVVLLHTWLKFAVVLGLEPTPDLKQPNRLECTDSRLNIWYEGLRYASADCARLWTQWPEP